MKLNLVKVFDSFTSDIYAYGQNNNISNMESINTQVTIRE